MKYCRFCGNEIRYANGKAGSGWVHVEGAGRLCDVSYPVKWNPDLRVQRYARPVPEGCLSIQDEQKV